MSEIANQASFNSGEWAPNLFARVDIQKYHSGAQLLKNWYVDYRGGASTRAGTKYVIQCLDSTKPVRLIPFQVTSTVGYILEFGDFTLRFIFQGSMVLEATKAITGATKANPCVLTIPASGYGVGSRIFVSGISGMTQLNNRYFDVLNVSGSNVTIGDLNGVAIDSTGYSTYISSGTAARIYTISTPYSAASLADLKYAQSINQMILCSPNIQPQVLEEIAPANWTLTPLVTGTQAGTPGAISISSSLAAGSANYGYKVTAVDANGEESQPSPVGNYNGAQDIRVVAGSINLNWSAVTNAVAYNVYKTTISYTGAVATGLEYGFIGSTNTTSFVDDNIAPDFTVTPPVAGTPFSGFDWPTVPSFFQQRLVLASPSNSPQTFWLSRPGQFFNFDTSSPSRPDDSIQGTLVSGVLNTIKSIVSTAAGMLILTDNASWMVNGGSPGAAISPSAIVANPQSFNGANDVPPITANYDVLYVQQKGSSIRDLAFNIYFSVFTGTDISILSSHLFFGFQITEWAWAEEPYKIVWAIRNDGIALSCTFLKEQDFTGWAHHITSGSFRSVATVTEVENTVIVDAPYFVVDRAINGRLVKYVERMATRIFPTLSASWCVDCGLSYFGSPTTTFHGGEALAGRTVTGIADGAVITPFVMPLSGLFTLPTPVSDVTLGIGYTCDLQTLALDMGEPSIQGKVKKIPFVDIRVVETLGLQIGNDFDHLTPMKDLVQGNVSSTLTGQENQIVSGLFTGDAKTMLSPTYTVPGQYCIRQDQPIPATILGVFPAVVVGDDR